MKTTRWLALFAVLLGAMGLVLVQADIGNKTDTTSADMRALRQQVEQLQAQLRTLEDRLAKLESAKSHVVPHVEVVPRSPGAMPNLIPSPLTVPGRTGQQPKIFGQGEINGWPFYVIPCRGQ